MTQFISITFSASHPNEAKRIALELVEQRLVACANLHAPVESIYHWQEKIEQTNETLCSVKTRKQLFAAVSAKIKELHSYTTPMIVAMELADIDPDYADWLMKELKS